MAEHGSRARIWTDLLPVANTGRSSIERAVRLALRNDRLISSRWMCAAGLLKDFQHAKPPPVISYGRHLAYILNGQCLMVRGIAEFSMAFGRLPPQLATTSPCSSSRTSMTFLLNKTKTRYVASLPPCHSDRLSSPEVQKRERPIK